MTCKRTAEDTRDPKTYYDSFPLEEFIKECDAGNHDARTMALVIAELGMVLNDLNTFKYNINELLVSRLRHVSSRAA